MISGKNFIQITICSMLILAFGAAAALAELTIDSAYPALGKMGEELKVTINGSGFDQNTKLYMYLDTGNRRKVIGSRGTPGNSLGVTVVGDKAFLADSESGLQVIDVSDPTQPNIIGSVDTQGQAWSVAVADDTAYVADGYSGLLVIDISDLSQPSIIGALETPGYAWDVKVVGNIAFMADDESGLQVIDISDPSDLSILGSADTPGIAYGLTVSGNTACVADGYGGLQVLDVSDPLHPKVSGFVYTPGSAVGVTVVDHTAFVADSSSGLQVIDISDLSDPVIIGAVDTQDQAWAVAVSGDTAFVADEDGGLQLVDVGDLSQPFITGSVETTSFATCVAVHENRAFVADYEGGLLVIDISDPPLPVTIGSVGTQDEAIGVSMAGNMAFVADSNGGLQIIDVNNTASPQIISSEETLLKARNIDIENDIAYIAAGLLYLIDISDPFNPEILNYFYMPSYDLALDVDVVEGKAFVASHESGLEVLDVSNPYNPLFLGAVDTPDDAFGVNISGDIAFVADGVSGLQVINVSDPSTPAIVGAINTPGSFTSDIIVANDIAYLADFDGGLQVADVSDPSQPKMIGAVDTPGIAHSVTLMDNKAFVADGEKGMQVIDVSDPHHPFILHSIDTPGDASDVAIMGDKAFVADSGNGLVILPVPYEIETIMGLTDAEIHATLPSPQIPGHYNLRIMNETGSDELVGAITFVDEEEYQSHIRDKAIILAGRTETADTLWESTKRNAAYAYNSLLFQGYSHDTILFLCSENIDVDGDGNSNTDLDATHANLNHAFDTWVLDPDAPANDLVFYMIGPGGKDHFRLNPSVTVSSPEISAFLDAVEPHLDGELVFIYDGCLSGSFFDALTSGPTGRRIVMTSTSGDESASFLNDGKTSFSYRFWNDIYKGYKVGYAFARARSEVSPYHQNALIHNDTFANTVYIGIGKVVAPIGPRIVGLAPDTLTLDGETSATISATIDSSNSVKYVKGTIIPPDISQYPSEEPITDLPEVLLTDSDEDGIYEGVYDCFTKAGPYTITISAEDKNDNRSYGADRLITVTQLTATVEPGDMNADCLVNLTDAIMALKAVTHDAVGGLQLTADLNDDGQIGIVDAIILLRVVSGM